MSFHGTRLLLERHLETGRALIPRISTPGTCMSIPARSDWGDCQSARYGHSEEGNYYLPFASFFMAPKYQYRCRQCIIPVLICTADRTDVAACCLRGKNKILVVIKYCHACRCRGATAWPNLIHSHVLPNSTTLRSRSDFLLGGARDLWSYG